MDAPTTGITHTVIPEHKLVYVIVRGENTISHLMDYIVRLEVSEPAYATGMDFLINATEARTTRQDSNSERNDLSDQVAQLGPRERVRTATVMPTGTVEYGLSRMYSVEMSGTVIDYQLFDDFGEALTWLDKPSSVLTLLGL